MEKLFPNISMQFHYAALPPRPPNINKRTSPSALSVWGFRTSQVSSRPASRHWKCIFLENVQHRLLNSQISPFSVWIRSFMIEHHSCSSLNQHLHFHGLYPNPCDSANHHDKLTTIQLKEPVTWIVTCTCFTFTIIPVTSQWVLSCFNKIKWVL